MENSIIGTAKVVLHYCCGIVIFCCLFTRFILRQPRHGHEVDAVPVSRAVGQVVTQVGARGADALAVFEDAHMLPIYLGVAKRWPAVLLRLFQKLLHGPSDGGGEQLDARDAVVKVDRFLVGVFHFLDALQKVGRSPVAGEFGVVAAAQSTSTNVNVVRNVHK